MNPDLPIDLARESVLLAIKLGLPLLAVCLAVGLLVSVLQAATQIQDQTISLIPRILLTGLAALFLLPWGLSELAAYSTELVRHIPSTW